MSASYYEKQVQWKQAVQSKVLQQREELVSTDQHATFNPTPKVSVELMDETVIKTGQHHINRLLKARKDKEDQQTKLLASSKQKRKPRDGFQIPAATTTESLKSASFAEDLANQSQVEDLYEGSFGGELADSEEESIVEVLERERRQWHAERVKLIHCIHIQQLELAQRSTAAHERAVDVAKDFAQTIESFEERLVSIEDNVQKELMAVKSLAESLNSTVASLKTVVASLQAQMK